MREDQTAKRYYRQSFREEHLDESLCRKLAALHERHGEHAQALEVLEALRAHLVQVRDQTMEAMRDNNRLKPEMVADIYTEKLLEVDEAIDRLRDR